MPFPRPTIDELITRTDTQISSRLGIGPFLRRSMLGVISRVLAGMSYMLHGFLDWVFRQVFVDTCEAEQLDRWASIWDILRTPAAFATGNVDITFSQVGITLSPGTIFRADDGFEYETLPGLISVVPGTFPVLVRALIATEDGNLPGATSINLTAPVIGITGTVVASGGLTGGAEEEPDNRLRERLLFRLANPPMGGAAADYVAWASSISEITRVWVVPDFPPGIGSLVVVIMADDLANPIPNPAKVLEVQTYVDTVRPVTAAVIVAAPVAVPLDLDITLTPNTAEVQAAVEASIEALLIRDAAPDSSIFVSRIREAISTAVGETNHVLNTVDGLPPADQNYAYNEIATMGTITW